jgi:S1-C subfamily serine protease
MALPAAAVDRIVDELLERGHVRRPFIGVAVQPVALPQSIVKQNNLNRDTALLVVSVADGSPAATAGVFVGDVLLEASGQSLSRPTDLLDALSSTRSSDALRLKVLRAGATKDVDIIPSDRGSE